ncbi:haloacetate dehalogenase [Amycolatopsis pretoriensis]|uniref:Haloacetate dehalogenase n=1 Tax=Amycolatopsis pretoriensis TaxID=218821 RepID=A0A1H5RHS4_9PSEU|nr:haloacetate dehalogenase [Amycolatopsis pretoriensis]
MAPRPTSDHPSVIRGLAILDAVPIDEALAALRRPVRAIHDPATVTAMLEDYRAGLGVDRAHDDADRAAGRRISSPALVLWSSDDDMADLYGDVLGVWRNWAEDDRGHAIKSGHHVAEDNPEDLAAALGGFFSRLPAG